MGDAPVAQRVQVAERETNAVRMVRADVRGPAGAAPDVDADQRHSPRRQVGDQRIVVVDADEDGCVEPMLAADVAGLEQQRVIARLRQSSRDRSEHLAEEEQRQISVAGVVADDNGDESCLLGHQRASDPIGAIADRTRHFPDSFAGLHAHVCLVIQRAGDGGDRYAGALGDILDRRSPAHDADDTGSPNVRSTSVGRRLGDARQVRHDTGGPAAPRAFRRRDLRRAGLSGHGFMIAPAVARIVADAVLGEPADEALAVLDVARFTENRPVPESQLI
jgi:hypothetical protein